MSQVVYIANITEQSWTLHRSYGTYRIRGTAPGESCALTPVCGVSAVMDLGDKRTLDVPISAREIAEDLCRQINADGGEDSFFGVFVPQGEKPAPAELEQARRRLAAADREWERSHSYLFINDVQRRAARHLREEKDWFYQPHETFDCPGCGEKVRTGVAVCKTCRAILDPEKAAKLGLLAPAEAKGPTGASAAPARR